MGGTLCRDQRCHVAAPLQRPWRLCKPGWNLTAGHEGRQREKDAWMGGSATVDPTPRAPEALAAVLVEPAAARAPARGPRAGRLAAASAAPASGPPGADDAGGDGA